MSAQPTIVVTRPQDAAHRFARALQDAGLRAPVVIAPVLRIAHLPGALKGAGFEGEAVRGVIFTSAHAIAAFVRQSEARPQAWCVGHATAAAARAAGFHAHSAAGHVDDLFRLMVGAGISGPFVHARGRIAHGALAQRLDVAGLPTTEVVIYDQIACDPGPEVAALLQGRAPVVLPLFSPRSARLVAKAAAGVSAPLHLVALSRAVADAWATELRAGREAKGDAAPPDPVRSLHIAARPDAGAMCAAVLAVVDSLPDSERLNPNA